MQLNFSQKEITYQHKKGKKEERKKEIEKKTQFTTIYVQSDCLHQLLCSALIIFSLSRMHKKKNKI